MKEAARAVLTRTPDRLVGTVAAVRDRAARRERRGVEHWASVIRETESLGRDRLVDWQRAELQAQLRHAFDHVPYYRQVFADAGAAPDDIRTTDDLVRLPTLDKPTLRERRDELLATNVSESERYYFTTGGSTGIPVGFYHDLDQPWREWAFMRAQWRRVGYRERETSVVLRGTVVPGGRLWQRDPLRGALVVSSYHLTDEALPRIVDRIRRFRPRFLKAYPSSAAIVARYLVEAGEPPIDGLVAVLCGSENLYEGQRRLIEQAFGCRVYSWYGQSEAVGLAGECERSSDLHVFPQYGVVELVNTAGEQVTKAGEVGEIVATSLARQGDAAHPLPHDRRGDAGRAVVRRPAGGRIRSSRRIEGRLQEFMISGSGRVISMTAINMHSPVFDNVAQFRFAQRVAGHVVLRVVPRASYDPDERRGAHPVGARPEARRGHDARAGARRRDPPLRERQAELHRPGASRRPSERRRDARRAPPVVRDVVLRRLEGPGRVSREGAAPRALAPARGGRREPLHRKPSSRGSASSSSRTGCSTATRATTTRSP